MFNLKNLLSLIALLMMAVPMQAFAQSHSDVFTVYLNDLPHKFTAKVRPCYPVMARFEHPNPDVTRVRMRYPYNHRMYMFFALNTDINIQLHEDYMKKGQLSLSDFIAEDDFGNEYGMMTLTFIPVDPDNGEFCDAYLNS